MVKDSRVVVSGDPDNKDRVHQSDYFDHTSWTSTGSDYADVGYKDQLTIKGMIEAFDGLYFVFKRSASQLATYYLSVLDEAAPSARKISDIHCPKSHYCVVDAISNIYFLEDRDVTMLQGINQQGKMVVDPTPGLKLGNSLAPTTSAHAVVYPTDRQIWFVPDPGLNKAYIYHYTRNAWTVFSFGSRHLYSMRYFPSDGKLYLGCDDGFVYRYELENQSYQDAEGSYAQVIKTKVFDNPPDKDKILKAPQILYSDLASGTGTLVVKSDYGSTTAYTGTITLTGTSYLIYDQQSLDIADTTATYIYDTQTTGSGSTKFDYNIPLDNFQFILTISSGGMRLNKIIGRQALDQYK
jgi:hypothetical protein